MAKDSKSKSDRKKKKNDKGISTNVVNKTGGNRKKTPNVPPQTQPTHHHHHHHQAVSPQTQSQNTAQKKSSASNELRSPKSGASLGLAIRSTSISSISSRYNLKCGRFTTVLSKSDRFRRKSASGQDLIQKFGESLYDSVVLYIYCPLHDKIALSLVEDKGQFLPFYPIKIGQSWIQAATDLVRKMLRMSKNNQKPVFNEPIMLDVLRFQIPTYFEFVTRVVYCFQLIEDSCAQMNLCKDNTRIAWLPLRKIDQTIIDDNFFGPEPALLVAPMKGGQLSCREITIFDVLFYLHHPNKNNPKSQLLHSMDYRESDLLKLYSDFFQHCYPSEFMTPYSFRSFLLRWGYIQHQNQNIDHLFKVFFTTNYYLNFQHFLLGLATIDKELAKKDKGKEPSIKIEIDISPLEHIRKNQIYPMIEMRQTDSKAKQAIQAKIDRVKEICMNCRLKNYTLSLHMVKMSSDGLIYEPTINQQADVERMKKNERRWSEMNFTKSFVCNQLIDMIRSYAIRSGIINWDKTPGGAGRRTSLTSSKSKQNTEPKYKFDHYTDKILKVLEEAKSHFYGCPRVIKVTTPCYIIGDIHGNLHDLLTYEKNIWKLGPYLTPCNYLFLGDYVDRGDYSLECILYLFCMKLMVPHRVFMLRGNHECRSLQKEYTFYDECKQKFGERGEELWEKFNDVFDAMPLCAIVDEAIFCAHGGIPSCALKIEQIMAVKSPLPDPDNESDIANEILWNDPVTNQEYHDLLKNVNNINAESSPSVTGSGIGSQCDGISRDGSITKLKKRDCGGGFLPNTKRGTACYFSEDALNKFLSTNGLTHVIRAHEVIPAGYQYHMGGRCTTIFSCSNYCGGINEAAVVQVYDSKIRVIKVDTQR